MSFKFPPNEPVYVVDWNLLQTMHKTDRWFDGKVCLISDAALVECLEKTRPPPSNLLRKFEEWRGNSSAKIYDARNVYELFAFQHTHDRLRRNDLIYAPNIRSDNREENAQVESAEFRIAQARKGRRFFGMQQMRAL